MPDQETRKQGQPMCRRVGCTARSAGIWSAFWLVSVALLATAADWPQWRGPNRDGISPETGLLRSWPASGPRLVWKAQGLGEGYSNLAIAQGRIFTQGQRGRAQFVIALNKASGRKLWQTPAGKSYRDSHGSGPRSTPTVDGDRVFALSADGTLVCLETSTGNTVWSLNIVKKFGGRIPGWGVSGSPLVDGNRVIVNPGGRGASIVALDKRNGTVLWRALSDPPGYSSPIAVQVGGTRQIIVFTGRSAVGVQAETGNALWRYRRVSNGTANIATPIFRDGHVFLSSDYGTGCALLKLTSQNGFWRAAEVYFNRNMRNHYSSSVLVGDHLYGFSSSILTAMHWKTGAVAWRDRSVGKGTVAYADGNLYLASEDGVVGLAEATPAGYREKSRFQISRSSVPMRAVPVISGGRLYLRDQDTLYCFDISRSQ